MNGCVILNLLTLNISWSLDIKTSCSFVLQLDGSEEFRAFWAGPPNERIWFFIFSWKNAIILVCTDLEFIYGIRIFWNESSSITKARFFLIKLKEVFILVKLSGFFLIKLHKVNDFVKTNVAFVFLVRLQQVFNFVIAKHIFDHEA